MMNFIHAVFLWLKGLMFPVARARRQLQHAAYVARTQGAGRQLLVDVSVIVQQDARTGIQRVVRALLLQLLENTPAGYNVRPVFATRKQGYCYAPADFLTPPATSTTRRETIPVCSAAGDVFLGLDLSAHLLPRHESQLASWKHSGVTLHVLVYDLLPLQHPEWFNAKTVRNFRRWIRTIAIYADSMICISRNVNSELTAYLQHQFHLVPQTLPVVTIPLGADIEASLPSKGLPYDIEELLAGFLAMPTVLMVGTIEPRKGHALALAAFEQIWQQGHQVNLVVVGRPGWKTSNLQTRMRQHPEAAKRFYWLEDVSDEMLNQLYVIATGLLIASEAEGYGLPLIEAASHGKPVLARDIPVFREVAGEGMAYFARNSNATQLAECIESWLGQINLGESRAASIQPRAWTDSARELVLHLGLTPTPDAEIPPENTLEAVALLLGATRLEATR